MSFFVFATLAQSISLRIRSMASLDRTLASSSRCSVLRSIHDAHTEIRHAHETHILVSQAHMVMVASHGIDMTCHTHTHGYVCLFVCLFYFYTPA